MWRGGVFPHPTGDAMTLLGIREKINRADVHMRTLHSEVGEWIRANNDGITFEFDHDAGELVLRGAFPDDPVTHARWGIILGDWAHNLRSSMDHLLWQIVLACGGTPGEHNQFPIYDDPDTFDDRVKKPFSRGRRCCLSGVNQEAFDLIESYQPYQGNDGSRAHVLAIVRDLNNADKHRVVPTTVLAMADQEPVVDGSGFDRVDVRYGLRAIQEDTELARLSFYVASEEDLDSDMELNAKFRVDVRFGDGQFPLTRAAPVRNGVVGILNHILSGFQFAGADAQADAQPEG